MQRTQQAQSPDHRSAPDMKPLHHFTNGDDGSGSEGSEGEAEAEAEELSLADAEAPARALAALNSLRKSRQHYDVLLVAGGEEVPAHRAVLAAASPYLLEALSRASSASSASPASPSAPPAPYRVEQVDADALRALVEYAYTGRLVVRDASAARRLYRAAWRLRLEPPRAHLADRLLRRLQPADCLAARALPGLRAPQLQQLDAYIAANFDEVCSSGAFAALPQIRIEVMRESSAAGGAEAPLTVADAALTWLRDRFATDRDFEELCSRTHLVYVDARGALRDCGELPATAGDAPELQQYRREATARRRQQQQLGTSGSGTTTATVPRALQEELQVGAREARAGDCAVLAARGGAGGSTRALLAVRGRLAAARASWSGTLCGGGGVARGGAMPGRGGGARMAAGRAALGAVALGDGSLLACGGYDRARVLRSAELYGPEPREWSAAPDMRRERARFPAARLRDTVYVIGGSDGHAELDSVDAYTKAEGWRGAARLPLPLSHAAAAPHAAAGVLYVAGGWAGGAYLRRAFRYDPAADAWSEAPPLSTGRAQCAGVFWEDAVWVLGGCDAWHCLATTERLALGAGAGAGEGEEGSWTAGPALPSARRSMGGCEWRGRLVSVGGSDGSASLRRTDWLEPGWTAAPHPEPDTDQGSGGGAGAWTTGPALRRARAGPGLAVVGEALFAVGGFDGKEFLACAETLLQPDGEWTALTAPPAPAPPLPISPEEPARAHQEAPEKRQEAASQ